MAMTHYQAMTKAVAAATALAAAVDDKVLQKGILNAMKVMVIVVI